MRTRHQERQFYRRTNTLLLCFALTYVTFSAGRKLTGFDEFFPVTSWALFNLIPSNRHDYSIRITSIDGKPLPAPLMFEDAAQYFPAVSTRAAWDTIQAIGQSLRSHNTTALAERRTYLEQMHLAAHAPVTYDLVYRYYDPLERYQTHTFRSIQTLATFTAPIRSTAVAIAKP
jgi:hypothetical protein